MAPHLAHRHRHFPASFASVGLFVAGTLLAYALLPFAAASDSAYWRAYMPARDLEHQTGAAVGNTSAWMATVVDKTNAYLSYGPYATDVPEGVQLQVAIFLAVDNNTASDASPIAQVDVHDAVSDTILASTAVRRKDFETANSAQAFVLFFTTPTHAAQLEYRVLYVCCAAVTHLNTTVATLNATGPITAFWDGTAHWNFTAAHVFPSPGGSYGANVGFHFVTRPGGLWVLFHREYYFSPQPQPAYCKADYARIVVRTSRDRGATWSNATVMASPVPNTPYECALVDGAGFYDADGGPGGGPRWLYLSQCLNRENIWGMCLFARNGEDPVGAFTPVGAQPTVASGQLWSQICAGTDKHCQPSMGSEGTPEIITKDAAGYYYITFHGWDPTHDASARGVAKTRDFSTWLTAGAALPDDAMFTGLDCTPWNISWASGGCVGGGAASILRSGDYYYMLIEAPDISLGCLTAVGQQNWVLGLLRAPAAAFLPTTQWAPFSAVPTVVPVVKQGCYIQYARIFADADGVYLTYWADNWLQFHVLVPGAAPLPVVAGPPPTS